VYPIIRWLKRRRKVIRGVYLSYFRRKNTKYNPIHFFDHYYKNGISDRQTIRPDTNQITSSYHYASIELIILREFSNTGFQVDDALVFDIGAGAGHWLQFYKRLGAKQCVGIDVSTIASQHLSETLERDGIEIQNGLFQDFLKQDERRYHLINGIGVMFHVVDDSEWMRGLCEIARSLKKGGLLIVGGHFGLFNKINVDYDVNKKAYKRLRSRMHWKRTLKALGFRKVKIRYNLSYLFIKDYVPENNVLFAWK